MGVIRTCLAVMVLCASMPYAMGYSITRRGLTDHPASAHNQEVASADTQRAPVYYPTDREEMGYGRIDTAPRHVD
ncbi:MAG: hypothetical protein GC159_07235 [Phycisphaera sp.]|nr:hypothetical protein [Phycisphaera sp.]